MNVGLVNNSFSGITSGNGSITSIKNKSDDSKIADMKKSFQKYLNDNSTVSSSQITENGRFNGDYTTGYKGTYSSEFSKKSNPTGAAVNQANPHVKPKTIDKTSELYEKSMELEGLFVKQMLSAMRKTVIKSSENDFAQNMYEDMLYDEYATAMTKNAGFGLADQIYLSLI